MIDPTDQSAKTLFTEWPRWFLAKRRKMQGGCLLSAGATSDVILCFPHLLLQSLWHRSARVKKAFCSSKKTTKNNNHIACFFVFANQSSLKDNYFFPFSTTSPHPCDTRALSTRVAAIIGRLEFFGCVFIAVEVSPIISLRLSRGKNASFSLRLRLRRASR